MMSKNWADFHFSDIARTDIDGLQGLDVSLTIDDISELGLEGSSTNQKS